MITKIIKSFVRVLNKELNSYVKSQKIPDVKSLNYTHSLIKLYDRTKNIPGHIVEIGAGSGRNTLIFSFLIKKNNKQDIVRYFGYDFFENHELFEKQNADYNIRQIKDLLRSSDLDDIAHLVKGDINKEIYKFEKLNLGFRNNKPLISLIYIDCNSYETTLNSLNYLKSFLSKGAHICTDQKKIAEEVNALKKFADENNLELKLGSDIDFRSTFCVWDK